MKDFNYAGGIRTMDTDCLRTREQSEPELVKLKQCGCLDMAMIGISVAM